MPQPSNRRLRQLGGQLAARPAPGAAVSSDAVLDDGTAQLLADAAGAAALRPLSAAQVAQFVREGFLILQLDDVPAEAHRNIFTACRRGHRSPVTEAGLQRHEASTGRPRHPDAALPADTEERLSEEEIASSAEDFAAVSRSEVLLGAARAPASPPDHTRHPTNVPRARRTSQIAVLGAGWDWGLGGQCDGGKSKGWRRLELA